MPVKEQIKAIAFAWKLTKFVKTSSAVVVTKDLVSAVSIITLHICIYTYIYVCECHYFIICFFLLLLLLVFTGAIGLEKEICRGLA